MIPVKIDIIILSYAQTDELKNTTLNGIKTLLASEEPDCILFNVLVLESNKSISPYQYPGTKTIYPDAKFGYHKYMNIGIKATANDYVCLCNNDLIFHKAWASEILKAMHNNDEILSASPYCSIFHKNAGLDENGAPVEGYFGVLIGWCIFARRKVFDIIGPLDERLIFWYCDADYVQELLKYKIKNYLVPSAKVTHIGSETLKAQNDKDYSHLTQLPRFYYNYKWFHKSYLRYLTEVFYFKVKAKLR